MNGSLMHQILSTKITLCKQFVSSVSKYKYTVETLLRFITDLSEFAPRIQIRPAVKASNNDKLE